MSISTRAEYLLSVGDGETDDYVQLAVEPNGWIADPPEEDAATREIQLAVVLSAATADALWTEVQDIQRKLAQAKAMALPQSGGSGVTLGVRLQNTDMVYFDVLRGTFSIDERYPNGRELRGIIQLTCLPYARGDSVSLAATATLTNPAEVWIADIPGDVDALCKITITDESINSAVINRIRLSRRSGWNLAETDFDPMVDLSAVEDGTTETDATDYHGADFARLSLTDEWLTFAEAQQPTARTYGQFQVFARVRDSSEVLQEITGLYATASVVGGSLPAGTYAHVVVAYDGSGERGAVSREIYSTLSDTGQVRLTWDEATGATGYYVYWKRDSEDWLRLDAGTTNPYTHDTETGATTEDPETSLSSALVRAHVTSGTTGEVLQEMAPVQPTIGRDRWEDVLLGTMSLPPLLALDAGDPEDWLVQLQALHPVLSTETLDVDVLYLVPVDEPQLELRYVSSGGTDMRMDTARTWRYDLRRDLRASAVVLDAGSVVARVAQRGRFLLSPGNNQVFVNVAVEEGVSDLDNDAQFTVAISYTPRYRLLAGV